MSENENGKRLLFSEEMKNLINFITDELSKELPTLTIDVDYFLLGALAQKDNDLFRRLDSCMMTNAIENIYNSYYQVCASKALQATKPNRTPSFDTNLMGFFEAANAEALGMGAEEVSSEHVFLAILANNDENNKIRKLFNKAGITYGIIKNKMSEGKPISTETKEVTLTDGRRGTVKIVNMASEEDAKNFMNELMNNGGMPDGFPGMQKKKGKNANIKAYCTDLNELAENGKMDPLIGRDKEINEIVRILGRKKKNNAILLGGEGVGKTAIGESLALKITNGEVPDFLLNKRLVSLDMTALMAGTTLRGMFEERVKGILDEIKADGNFILFMDNIGAILADKGKNDYEISAMLARSLETGDVQVIGTSDFTSYRKTFDKDPSLARRFQKILVEAPSVSDSLDILNGLKPSYEKFHKVRYEDDAITECVTLANKYITERNLPDSAIDVMDEVGSVIGTTQEPDSLKELRKSITSFEKNIEDSKANNDFATADALSKNLKEIKVRYNEEKAAFDKVREDNPSIVTKDDILKMVSIKTNIPVTNLTADDKKKLANMNERIKANVVGQDNAVDTICKALKRNRIGLHKNGCLYSLLSIGATGIGKTFIAKQLAKELFGDEKALVRFDMSEFSDKVAVNKLIGSNPGYVGYEEGGQLTEKIKNKKHCVLLLDEIEKADPEIYNIFLQVLDEGFLTDNSGQKIDFKNVIVIFTSNVGAKAASDFGKGMGLPDDNKDENTKRILLKQLKNRFPPEFLNRLDDVIYFNSLTDDNLKDIIKIEIKKLEGRLNGLGYGISYDESVLDYILNIVKDEKEYGARPIMRAIQDNIEDKITDVLLENEYENGYQFKVSCYSGESIVVA